MVIRRKTNNAKPQGVAVKGWLGKKAARCSCDCAVQKAPPNQSKQAHEPKRKGKAPRISRKREGPKHKRISSTTPSLPPTPTSTPRNPRRRRRNPRRGGDHRSPLCWRRERAALKVHSLSWLPAERRLPPLPRGSSRPSAGRSSALGLVEFLLESFRPDEDWFLLRGALSFWPASSFSKSTGGSV